MIWLMVIGLLSGPITYGIMKVQELKLWRAAYEQGKQAGMGSASVNTVAAAGRTAEAERQAEAETPPISPDKQAIIELCKRRASCRERGTLQ